MNNVTNPYRHREVSAEWLIQAPTDDCIDRENLISKELNQGCR